MGGGGTQAAGIQHGILLLTTKWLDSGKFVQDDGLCDTAVVSFLTEVVDEERKLFLSSQGWIEMYQQIDQERI